MLRRLAALFALCLSLLLSAPFCTAIASETPSGELGWVDPTRKPDASEYSTKTPGALLPEHLVAETYILMERSTGEILFYKDMDKLMFPASTTKILTALMALQFGNLEDTLTVSEGAVSIPEDASRVPFKAGEEVTLMDALYGLLLKSGNDAANAIAEYVSGDVDTFVARMNEVAQVLGCVNTRFTNPHGYQDTFHVTTARDLALMMDAALDDPMFRQIIASESYTLASNKMNPERKIFNTNLHILKDNERYYRYSLGGKTGFTSEAGYVLVEAAAKDGVELIAVVMYTGVYSRWPDVSRLFEYGFSKYKSVTPEQIYNGFEDRDGDGEIDDNRIELEIKGFATDDEDLGRLKLDIRAVNPGANVRITRQEAEIDTIVEQFFTTYTSIQWASNLRAPIAKGQVMGTLTFYERESEAVYELIATRAIAARGDAPPTLEEIEQRVLADPSPFPPFGLDWVLPPILGVLAALWLLRTLLRVIRRRHKGKRQIPKPKRRYFS